MFVEQVNVDTITNTTAPSYNFEYITPLVGGMVENERYDFLVGLEDSYTRVTQSLVLPVATCIMNIEKDGVGIGKYYEKGGLDVGGDIHCSGWLNVANGIKLQYDNKYIEQTKAISWTPYLALSNGVLFTISSSEGQYAVLGDYIWFQCRLIAVAPENIASFDTDVRIYGLPYVCKYNYPSCSVGWCSGFSAATSWNGYGAYVEATQSYIHLNFMFTSNGVGLWQQLRSAHLTANRTIDLSVSGIYRWR